MYFIEQMSTITITDLIIEEDENDVSGDFSRFTPISSL